MLYSCISSKFGNELYICHTSIRYSVNINCVIMQNVKTTWEKDANKDIRLYVEGNLTFSGVFCNLQAE